MIKICIDRGTDLRILILVAILLSFVSTAPLLRESNDDQLYSNKFDNEISSDSHIFKKAFIKPILDDMDDMLLTVEQDNELFGDARTFW